VFVSRRESLPEADPESCNSDIWVINADGTNPKQLTSSDGSSSAPQWSPGGTHIAFGHIPDGHDGSLLYIMNADGANQRQLTSDDIAGSHPSWSPGGEYLVFDSRHRIYQIRVDGTELHLLEHTVRQGQEPNWSPA
jgi:TolB protein